MGVHRISARLLAGTWLGRPTCLSALILALACVLPPVASAAALRQTEEVMAGKRAGSVSGPTLSSARSSVSGPTLSSAPSNVEPYSVCASSAEKDRVGCMAVSVPTPATRAQAEAESLFGLGPEPGVAPNYQGTGKDGGFSPADLREAYDIPETGGTGQTVAIVDAYDDPNAEADLKAYRSTYKLPECTKANKCFKKVNQEGREEAYPTSDYPLNELGQEENWGIEISLDVDMVSAVCPNCKILLVEANTNEIANMFTAEEEAEKFEEGGKKVATEISNSWATREFPEETEYDRKYLEHATVPITAAGGDRGYGSVNYPAASKYVISVGGTELYKAEKTEKNPRGWVEEQWASDGETGSGCSAYEQKPAWQSDPDCANRTTNDTAAVASPTTPVSVYDSYKTECTAEESEHEKCWQLLGGTSAATPIVAAIEAHASETVRKEGAEAFYGHALFNVTNGGQGGCHTYLCISEPGYNGPSGWGSPDGPLELSSGYHAVTTAPANLTTGAATLSGYVNPAGTEATAYFEYGKTTAYEAGRTTAHTVTGTIWKGETQGVAGLEPDTVYHYRIVASNQSDGTVHGEDRTFTTSGFNEEQLPTGASAETETLGTSCVAQECVAVGAYWKEHKPDAIRVPLAERLSGAEWVVQPIPAPSEASESVLASVSCVSGMECVAVGHYEDGAGVVVTLAERWNGKEWAIQSTPNPSGASGSVLASLSCVSGTECMAVGDYGNAAGTDTTVDEQWNGTEWQMTTHNTLNPGSYSNFLSGVSCVSANACTAVGSYSNKVSERSSNSVTQLVLAERWNGTEWTVQSAPDPGGTEQEDESWLGSISCASATSCTAVGHYQQGGGIDNTEVLGERWNGTAWTTIGMVAPPQPPDSWRESPLTSVSCTEATRCVAVGNDLGAGVGEEAPYLAFTEVELSPPGVTVEPPSEITKSTTVLHAAVDPYGAETKYYFEYGLTTAYGSKTQETSAGPGSKSVKVSWPVSGLAAGATYHYRLVAVNGYGTSYGSDTSFTAGEPVLLPLKGDAAFPLDVSLTGGKWKLNATGGDIKCETMSGSGVLTGAKGGHVTLKLTGCTLAGLKCGTTKYSTGEIETKELNASLVYTDPVKTSSEGREVGLLLSPTSGEVFAEIKCALESQIAIDGSLVAEVSPLNTQTSTLSLALEHEGESQQIPSKYETEGGEVVGAHPTCVIGSIRVECDEEASSLAIALAGEEGRVESSRLPAAVTDRVSKVESSAVELNGTVNPEGMVTKDYFEYGPTESYGSRTPEAGSGSDEPGEYAESASITGLTAGDVYHYRIVAVNAHGATYGADMSFTPGEPTLQPVRGDAAFPLAFSFTGGKWKMAPSGAEVKCEAMSGSGTFTNVKSGHLTLKLTGCTLVGLKCGTAKYSTGEIETKELSAEIAFPYPKEFNEELGVRLRDTAFVLSPASGEVFAEFKCEIASPIVLKGSVIAEVASIGTESSTVELAIKQKNDVQTPSEYETESGKVLAAHPTCVIGGSKVELACGEEASSPAMSFTGEDVVIERWLSNL